MSNKNSKRIVSKARKNRFNEIDDQELEPNLLILDGSNEQDESNKNETILLDVDLIKIMNPNNNKLNENFIVFLGILPLALNGIVIFLLLS